MMLPRPTTLAWAAAVFASILLIWSEGTGYGQSQPAPPAKAANSTVRPVGTIKAINGNAVTVTTDSGSEITVLVQSSTRVLRMAPGQKDLKDAAPLPLTDLQPGDRMIIRGSLAADGKSVVASSLLVMRKADIEERQEREREDWQKRGVGGLVSAVNPASGTITLSTAASGSSKTISVRVSKDTIVRRYVPESVRFQDAKPGTLDQIKSGDQLRARGALSADGGELSAEEIVSGSFRNIAGTVAAIDPGESTLSVMDLFTKKPVSVKITGDSQLRKVPPMVAQRIATRLKGSPPAVGNSSAPKTDQAPGEAGSSRPRGAGDLQQMLNRLPAVTLADLQKGDAVMLVTMQGGANNALNAITLLTGVEPILTASPNGEGAAMLLSPWSLGSAGGEAAAQ
ncbi:MAG: DUF5666 domain-containing protein [Terriglobales bacterium]